MQDSDDADWRRTWHAMRDVIGSKWALHVLRALSTEDAGFNELRRQLDGVTAKVLSERLRELRCLGFVSREVHATTPPTTTYRLTDAGRALSSTLFELESLVDVVDCPDRDCAVPVDGSACEPAAEWPSNELAESSAACCPACDC